MPLPLVSHTNEEIMTINESENILERAMMELVHNEPFFANLLLNMKRIYDYNIPTIGVSVTETVNLWVNPYFWNALDLKAQVDVLKHECYHVIYNHFTRFAELEPTVYNDQNKKTIGDRLQDMTTATTLNKAGDYAINEYLPNLPKHFHVFDKDGNKLEDEKGKPSKCSGLSVKELKKYIKSIDLKDEKGNPVIVENLKNMEYYYSILKLLEKEDKKGDGDGKGGCGGMTIDDHSVWATGNQDPEYVNEKIKGIVDKAVEAVGGREAGNIPADVILAIEALNHKPRNWKTELRRFVARTSEIFVETSRKKRNRRYGTLYAGNTTYQKLHLAVMVDTSGSVGDLELAQFGAEIYNITKQNVVVTVIEFDTRVNNVYKLESGDIMREVVGRGGTMFECAFTKAEELEVDGIIMFSDMENGDSDVKIKKPKVPMLWACLESGSKPRYNWGSQITVTVKKKLG